MVVMEWRRVTSILIAPQSWAKERRPRSSLSKSCRDAREGEERESVRVREGGSGRVKEPEVRREGQERDGEGRGGREGGREGGRKIWSE